jgi:hypothetical protein
VRPVPRGLDPGSLSLRGLSLGSLSLGGLGLCLRQLASNLA